MQDLKLHHKNRKSINEDYITMQFFVARSDTLHSSCLQMPVAPVMWKSSQSMQQVMPCMAAGWSSASSSTIVESCPLTKLNGGLSRLHSADEDAVLWLNSYG